MEILIPDPRENWLASSVSSLKRQNRMWDLKKRRLFSLKAWSQALVLYNMIKYNNLIDEIAFKAEMDTQGDLTKFATVLIQGLNSDLSREAQETVYRRLNFTLQNEKTLKYKVRYCYI